MYISRTSKKCDIPVQVLKAHIDSLLEKSKRAQKRNEWRSITAQTTYIRDDINPEAVRCKKEARAEETIIYFLLKRPEEWAETEKIAPADIFVTPFNKKVYSAILERMKNCENFSLSSLNNDFSEAEMGRISGIAAKNREITVSREVVNDCAAVLRNSNTRTSDELSNEDLISIFRAKSQK